MKKMQFILLFFLVCFVYSVASAAEFNENSAAITNKYYSNYKPGFRELSVGTENMSVNHAYLDVGGTAVVDGVNCIILYSIYTYDQDFEAYWAAEDVTGALYILQYQHNMEDKIVYGKQDAVLAMPTTPAIGDTIEGADIIVELNVTVPQLSTGLGPFTECIKIQEPDGDLVYKCPGLGTVKRESNSGVPARELLTYFESPEATFSTSTGLLNIPTVVVDGKMRYTVELGGPYNIINAIPK